MLPRFEACFWALFPSRENRDCMGVAATVLIGHETLMELATK